MRLFLTGIPYFAWDSGIPSLVHIVKVYRQVYLHYVNIYPRVYIYTIPKSLRATSESTALAVLLLIKKGQIAQHVQGEP